MELAHLKDNFRNLADQNDGLKYWKEDTLCRFLCLPDALEAGPVIYQMASYLGAFPFPSLAPSILTLEAIVKVVVIMTERYSRILKRGRKDRIKLLFRSLAVFDRRTSTTSPSKEEKPNMEELVAEQKRDEMVEEEAAIKDVRSYVAGFAIDEPANDAEEDEDDDELALAALDSLDAIEVFKQDQRDDRKMLHAQIPVRNFRRLLVLLLALAPLESQESPAMYNATLSAQKMQQLQEEADSIIATLEPNSMGGITYQNFARAISSSLPYVFEPLNALFEHFLFSKNLDMSKHRATSSAAPVPAEPTPSLISPIVTSSSMGDNILNEAMLAHLSTFMVTSPATSNLFHAHTRFHPLYSTLSHGTSMSSFSRQVLSWQAATLLLVSGSTEISEWSQVTIGAYVPYPWSKPAGSGSATPHESPSLFMLRPRHAYFPSNPYHRTAGSMHGSSSAPFTHFSTKTGISVGCIIPPSSRHGDPQPVPGPISLHIDTDFSTALLTYTPDEGSGAFLPDASIPTLVASKSHGASHLPSKLTIDISSCSIYGLSTPDPNKEGEDDLTRQKKRLAWEEAEAERRRGINFGGDKEGARALLEMAGIVGDQGRSGGSV